ncbi:MAG: hypothetical protein ACTS4T_00965 [Candidatus Hodgkinia cicadicola]
MKSLFERTFGGENQTNDLIRNLLKQVIIKVRSHERRKVRLMVRIILLTIRTRRSFDTGDYCERARTSGGRFDRTNIAQSAINLAS